MPRLEGTALKRVTVYVGEKNFYERQQLRDMFLAQGVKAVVCHATLEALREVLLDTPPDMLVLSDDFDPTVFEIVREIRHQKLSENPFMLITMLVDPSRRRALNQAIKAGVDDIVIKPLTAERVRERINLIAFHRAPFIANGTYVGPERRSERDTVRAKRIPVLNTLLEKVNGRDFSRESLKEAIEQSLSLVLQAQLDSQGSQLGELCSRLIHAYDTRDITIDVQSDLLMLSSVLQDASDVAARLRDLELVALCKSLSDSIVKLADHYDEPSTKELELLRKVTTAFQMATEVKNRGSIGPLPVETPVEVPPPGELDLSVFATATN